MYFPPKTPRMYERRVSPPVRTFLVKFFRLYSQLWINGEKTSPFPFCRALALEKIILSPVKSKYRPLNRKVD